MVIAGYFATCYYLDIKCRTFYTRGAHPVLAKVTCPSISTYKVTSLCVTLGRTVTHRELLVSYVRYLGSGANSGRDKILMSVSGGLVKVQSHSPHSRQVMQ